MSQNNPKWRVRTPRAGEAAGVEVYNGTEYVCQMSHHPAQRAQAAEYARRIVACVNACEGVPTDVLENTVQRGGALMYQQERRKAAEAQRDELLAALESLVLFTNPKPSNAVALNNAHQVIARAKGGAA